MSKLLIEEIFTESQLFTHHGGNKYPNGFDKGFFFSKLGELDKKQFEEFMDGLKRLIHHKDTTVGLYAMDSRPGDLLEKFWQKSSDSCPLEATTQEQQEDEFFEFANKLYFEIEFL